MTLNDKSGNKIDGDVSWVQAKNAAVFQVENTILSKSEIYTFKIDKEVKDTKGLQMEESYTHSFTP